MERAVVDGVTVEYEVAGPATGEPVVCVHGAFIAATFRPLLWEPALTGRYRLVRYHRRGYAGSSRAPGPVSVSRQAADCLGLLRHLGADRAHVVGHSLGACVAVQLALDAPGVVGTLSLLEPALFVGDSAAAYREGLLRSRDLYRRVGGAAAVDQAVAARWPGYRPALERILPGAFDQAVADAETVFEMDAGGHLDWRFDQTDAQRISQPALVVLGGDSAALHPRFGETHQMLLQCLPDAQGLVLPGTTHFMQMEDPAATAQALADFFTEHPLRR